MVFIRSGQRGADSRAWVWVVIGVALQFLTSASLFAQSPSPDPGVTDHGDPAVAGSLASLVQRLSSSGGEIVLRPAGGAPTVFSLGGGTLSIPEAVRLTFAPGALLADGELVHRGALQADPNQLVFASTLRVDLSASAVPTGYPAWMEGRDIGERVNRLVQAGIKHIYVADTAGPQSFATTMMLDRPGVSLEIHNSADLRYEGTSAACEIRSDDVDLRGGVWTYAGEDDAEVSGIRVNADDEHINGIYLWPGKIIGFTHGLHLYSGSDTGSGSGWGICYSRFRWKGLINNRNGITLETAGNGWINSCVFEGYRTNAPAVDEARGIRVLNHGWNIQAHRFLGNWEHLDTVLDIQSDGKWIPVGYEVHGYFEDVKQVVRGSSQEVFVENWRNRHVFTQIFSGSRYYTTLFDLRSDNPAGNALLRRVQTAAEGNEPGLEYVTDRQPGPLFKILENGDGFVHRGQKAGFRVWNVVAEPGEHAGVQLCNVADANAFQLEITATTDDDTGTAYYAKIVVSTHRSAGTFHAETVTRVGFDADTVAVERDADAADTLWLRLGAQGQATTRFHVRLQGLCKSADAPF